MSSHGLSPTLILQASYCEANSLSPSQPLGMPDRLQQLASLKSPDEPSFCVIDVLIWLRTQCNLWYFRRYSKKIHQYFGPGMGTLPKKSESETESEFIPKFKTKSESQAKRPNPDPIRSF